jgi:hypothetical protein
MHVECHVLAAWCPFITAVNFSSHLPSLSFVLHPLVLNMFLWGLFATNSVVIIIIFLLTASRPSDALPVDSLPPQQPTRRAPLSLCGDLKPSPCVCSGAIGLGDSEVEPVDAFNCGPNIFDFQDDPRKPMEPMKWASHLFFLHRRQY